ncbi:MAG: helix-turn-helix transcriptional regulator [Ruminococcaceae bacterium]|nr:helix-turn-helix transcriptional regulator [Oscillospiraceae bacterium]
MNITLNEQLKKLRKKKGNTQEDLANHLGVTVQAVSKWERGEGYPDITLLPAVSAYYNVSIDELLGVGQVEREKKIEAYRDKNSALFREGKSSDRVALMRKALAEFPNDLRLVYDLMYALRAENSTENADEIIELGERILDESTENYQREGAIQCLCYTYRNKGDVEAAKKYAGMGGSLPVTVNALMPTLLEGEAAVAYCQSNLREYMDDICRNVDIMAWKGNFPPEEEILLRKFALDCFKLLYSDENYGFYHCRVSNLYHQLGNDYMRLGQVEEMFVSFEKAAEHAIKFDTRVDCKYTAFMVNRLTHTVDSAYKNYTENDSAQLMQSFKGEAYAAYHDHPRMKAIMEKLSEVAVF